MRVGVLNLVAFLASLYSLWYYGTTGNHAAAFAWGIILINSVTNILNEVQRG